MPNAWLGQNPRELVRSLRMLADDLEQLAEGRSPAAIAGAVKIREFTLSSRTVPCLVGRMTGHPTVRDGSPGISTELYYVNEKQKLVRTFNRFYRLVGDPL
ncbi:MULTISPECIES: hypothetical protein [unclassified Rhizobium]|uniref:hypothetical protein n=1 Tax=unclassified Rhizobium TaxID=2613769 RepID=UPI001AE587F2|nr:MULTISPECIES: hypothetical protein [unclassified Rhizobium]MBP2461416.1 hypothetical protein [Rhizobium sp. PvP014]MBP2528812.1 hypothetical protein [Rhizobium sp. PvP099]